jgi:FG-GAP-like repeat
MYRFQLIILWVISFCHFDVVATPVSEQVSRATSATGDYIAWREHRIDDEGLSGIALRGADGLVLADIDGDGRQDVVSVHEDSNHVRIAFAASTFNRWDSITLAKGALVKEVEDVDVGDMDNDGDLDIVVAVESGGLVVFVNPGEDVRNSDKWLFYRPVNTLNRGSFIRVALADLNQDGLLEVIAANKGDAQASAGKKIQPSFFDYLNLWRADPKPLSVFSPVLNEDSQAFWPEKELARIRVPINAEPVDLDGDGDLDIVGGGRGHLGLVWFENQDGSFVARWLKIKGWWQIVTAGIPFLTGQTLAFDDVNGDGRLDIITQLNLGSVGWLEQPKTLQGDWVVHRLGSVEPDHIAAIQLIDVDDDGRRDIFIGGYSKGPRDKDVDDGNYQKPLGRLAWFRKLDDTGVGWQRFDVSRRIRGMFDEFVVVDIDHDGDQDLVGTRGNSGQFDGVFWLEQYRSNQPIQRFSSSRVSDSTQVELSSSLKLNVLVRTSF